MYEAYFRLQRRPFSATPDANCFFAPASVQSILDELLLRAASGQGIGILTAAAGTGKTLLCRRLLLELGRRFTPLFLANANFPTRRALLQAIHFELGRRYGGMEEQDLRLELISSLRGLVLAGRPAVLVVDEAHLLNERLLEEIRTLANLDEGEQPVLRVILVGQMALEMRLIDPALEALNQRIVCHADLEPLTRQQSREYIVFRVQWAGGEAAELFDEAAIELIAEASSGLPRCLNQLCDHSLLLTFVQEAPRVTRDIVEQALADLRQLPLHWNESAAMADQLGDEQQEDGLGDVELVIADDWELETTAGDGRDATPSGEPTVTFEIGGDAPFESAIDAVQPAPEYPWVRVDSPAARPFASGTEVTAAEESHGAVRVFREEVVEDRYAALDLLAPRVARTFEETVVGDEWRQPTSVPPAAPPESPARRSEPARGDSRESTVSRSDMRPPGVPAPPIDVAPAPDEVRSSCSNFDADDSDPRLIEEFADVPREVEEELGSTVLDVCLEVQNSLGNWWEPHQAETSIGDGAACVSDDFPAVDSSRFDVVEPGGGDDVVDPARGRVAGTHRAAAPGRHVPQPNYRHVFSALRRRLGRSAPRR